MRPRRTRNLAVKFLAGTQMEALPLPKPAPPPQPVQQQAPPPPPPPPAVDPAGQRIALFVLAASVLGLYFVTKK